MEDLFTNQVQLKTKFGIVTISYYYGIVNWVGKVEEIQGVIAQAPSLEELFECLQEILDVILSFRLSEELKNC
jgi:predicted RNase H-like HicB family nuclease